MSGGLYDLLQERRQVKSAIAFGNTEERRAAGARLAELDGEIRKSAGEINARKRSRLPASLSPPREPNIVRKFVSMCYSVAMWRAAGSPVRTQERVNELLAICQACPLLSDAGGQAQRCGKCGCPVNGRIDEPTSNKLAMATESCPDSPSKWLAEV